MLGCGRSSTVQQKCEVDADCPTGQGCNEYDVCVALPIAQVERPTDKKDGGTAAGIPGAGSPDAGPECLPCEDGFVMGDACNCENVDECEEGEDNCAPEAVCRDTPGSFECDCGEGYEGNGTVCTDTDGCDPNPCYAGVACTDVAAPGEGYTCGACPSGLSGDGEVCEDTDGCASDPCYVGAEWRR